MRAISSVPFLCFALQLDENYIDYANIAGFIKVADALIDQGGRIVVYYMSHYSDPKMPRLIPGFFISMRFAFIISNFSFGIAIMKLAR